MAGIVTMFFQIILLAYSQPSILLRNPDQSAAENCKKKQTKKKMTPFRDAVLWQTSCFVAWNTCCNGRWPG